MRWLFALTLLGAASAAPSIAAQEQPAALIVHQKDLVYGKGGDQEMKLDLAAPKGLKTPTPAVVCIHGGGWRGGNRKDLGQLTQKLAEKGYVAVTVSYRLTPDHPFPCQIEDCKCAVRWLRANAARLSVDPDRIGAIGFSAGGHLACLLGTADKGADLEGKGGHLEHSSRVQAVVSFFGPTDFTVKTWDKAVEDFFLKPLLGGAFEDRKAAYAKASPIEYVTKDDPPFLFFHGARDKLVNIDESHKLCRKLKDAGVGARVVTLEKEGHGWGGETLLRTIDESIAFFDEKLKK